MSRSRLRSALSFPRFAALTTGLTLTLVMLGIYTAATGSGLACSAQWPLCDGGLLPQTIPSFVEWFHRLVAMITGFFILGTALWAWRRPDARTRSAATLAVLLLPLQISIGAVTVTLSGMFPSGYSPPAQGAHLVVALTIFTLLVLTTLYAHEGRFSAPPLALARRALAVGLVALVVSVLFSRVVPVPAYTPAAQAAYYGASLVLFATLVAATRWLGASPSPALRYLSGSAIALVFVGMLLGRDLVYYTPTVRTLNAGLFVAAGVVLAATTWLAGRVDASNGGRGSGVPVD
ncbi:COX15/CtaA family protein [Salinirarus marinus]|uniref:COX15/CtaA family protein n=1 Tax=Salinirarus marinus TaxID=3068310 RepID=UPI003C6C28D8